MSSAPPRLHRLRHHLRRLQLTLGVGFLAYVLGAILTASLVDPVGGKLAGLPPDVGWALCGVFDQLWAYTFAPVLCFALGRAFDLAPVPTAASVLGTGLTFFLSLVLVSTGVEAFTLAPPAQWVGRGIALVLGVWLTHRALLAGRRRAARAEAAAQATAAAQKARCAEMMEEAERLAARSSHASASFPQGEAPP